MTDLAGLDRARIRELFDLRSAHNLASGGSYRADPYPEFHRLRESGPVHEGTAHHLLGHEGEFYFEGLPYPELEHFTAFSYASCDQAFRDAVRFASSPGPLERDGVSVDSSLLAMGGPEHRRYRGLVQPSFVPAKARSVDRALDRRYGERPRRPDRRRRSRRAQCRLLCCYTGPHYHWQLRDSHRPGAGPSGVAEDRSARLGRGLRRGAGPYCRGPPRAIAG